MPNVTICWNSCLAAECLAGSSLRGRDTGSSPFVSMWCTTPCLAGKLKSGGAYSAGYFDNNSPKGPSTELFMGVGVSQLTDLAMVEMDVKVSISFLAFRSTTRLYFTKKSAPIIGLLTCATTKLWMYSLRSPKSTETNLVPNVLMGVPFAADKQKSMVGFRFLLKIVGGITDKSAPVSIKKFKLFFLSLMNKRRLLEKLPLFAAHTEGYLSFFPSVIDFHSTLKQIGFDYKAVYIFLPGHHI